MKTKKICCLALLLFMTPALLMAQDTGENKKAGEDSQKVTATKKVSKQKKKKNGEINLSKVVVKGEVFSEKDSAYSINRIDAKKIEKLKISRTADILNEVPGVNISEYGQGGLSNAVTMRGFNSGIHGGDMGIYLDGIPLNEYYGHGGGYGDPNVLVPLELDRVMVYKGPTSALFGNFSRAGTVAFFTRKKGEYTDLAMKTGSNNTFDTQAALGTKIARNFWVNAALQAYRTDGYTENSEHLYGNASTRLTWQPTKKLEISLSLRAHGASWNAPDYITRTQWEDPATRFLQDPGKENDGGERNQFSERLDASYSINDRLKVIYWAFGLQADWIRWRTKTSQSEKDYHIHKYGTGANVNYRDKIFSITGGIEYYADDTDYEQWDSSYREKLTQSSNISTVFHNLVFFGEGEIKIHRFFRPTVGVRADLFAGKEKDYLNSTSSRFHMDKYWHISPKAGFVSTLITNWLDFKFSTSNGFIMPSASAISTGADVDPAQIWQYEAGFIGTFMKYAKLDITGYILDTTNEIQDTTGSGDYQNVGETRRMGIESDLQITPIKGLEIKGSLTYTHSEILKSPENPATEGKAIVTVPKIKTKMGIEYTSPLNLGGRFNWTFAGESWVDGENTEKCPSYHLLDIAVFYTLPLSGKKIDLQFEIKNLANEHYASFAGWGLWSTGAPRTYWFSANMKW